MSIFYKPGLSFCIQLDREKGNWSAYMSMPDETQSSRSGFANKSEAFMWVEQQFERWRLAA